MNVESLSIADLLAVKRELQVANQQHEQRKKTADNNSHGFIDGLIRKNTRTVSAITEEVLRRLNLSGVTIHY